jgi:hypothetical protein
MLIGSTDKIDSFIGNLTFSQEIHVALPQSHPIHLGCNYGLGISQFCRYRMSGQEGDLDKAIFHLTQVIFIPPLWPNDDHRKTILQASSILTFALMMRLEVCKLPDDAISVAKTLRRLRDQQARQSFGLPRHPITALLVWALARQVDLEAGNVMENIGEMAVLCHELITLDTSSDTTSASFECLFTTLVHKIHLPFPDQPLEQIIECLRAGRAHQLCTCEARIGLAIGLFIRYCKTSVNDDYEEAASILDEFVTSSPPEDTYVALARHLVTVLALLRSTSHCTPEYSEEAMYRVRALSDSSSVEEPTLVVDRKASRGSVFGTSVSSKMGAGMSRTFH